MRILAPAMTMNEIATPVSTRRSAPEDGVNRVTARTNKVAISASPKAITGTVNSPINRPVCNKARIAPNAPPEEIPSRCGCRSPDRRFEHPIHRINGRCACYLQSRNALLLDHSALHQDAYAPLRFHRKTEIPCRSASQRGRHPRWPELLYVLRHHQPIVLLSNPDRTPAGQLPLSGNLRDGHSCRRCKHRPPRNRFKDGCLRRCRDRSGLGPTAGIQPRGNRLQHWPQRHLLPEEYFPVEKA